MALVHDQMLRLRVLDEIAGRVLSCDERVRTLILLMPVMVDCRTACDGIDVIFASMTPDQIAELRIPSDPRLSPDGGRVVYVVSRPDLEEDRYDRSLWVDDRQFTEGPGDNSPRWSPDGKLLAFLRSVDGEPAQIAIMPIGGGEPRSITDFELGVEALEWSPDGERLVAVVVEWVDEWADLDKEDRSRRPRRVTTVPHRFDNKGWTHDRKRHLWIIEVDGRGEPERLTEGSFDEESPAWSPHGDKIAFISDRDPGQGLVSGNDVWEVDVASRETSQVTERGFWTFVSYRGDGALHLLGNTNPRYPIDSYLYRREEDGRLTELTGHLDRGSVSLAAGPAAIKWDGKNTVLGREDSGTFGLIEVSPDGS
ncbi:MAG TPA: hypothetical protein VFT85_08150, partial [Acidimicrobiia bacterium]|nr:hypothetical protein [Acidimicrobiia bacterium]